MTSTDSPIQESWIEFGKNLDRFIKNERKNLQKEKFDIILGFTRGGMILSGILSTMIRDSFKDTVTNKPHFCSVRAIPSGVTTKNYRSPCFVISRSMTDEEFGDAENLLNDLKDFIKENKINELSILLVDDNLTAGTRIFVYKDFLQEYIAKVSVKTLAYIRNEYLAIPQLKLDYVIRKKRYPNNKYFVMPYHDVHPRKSIDSLESQTASFVVKVKPNFKFQNLVNSIGSILYGFDKHGIYDNTMWVKRGGSTIALELDNDKLFIDFNIGKYYPPKECLDSDLTDHLYTFENAGCGHSLCVLGSSKLHIVCFMCSTLNCNKDILEAIMRTKGVTGDWLIQSTHQSEPTLMPAILKWFRMSFRNRISARTI